MAVPNYANKCVRVRSITYPPITTPPVAIGATIPSLSLNRHRRERVTAIIYKGRWRRITPCAPPEQDKGSPFLGFSIRAQHESFSVSSSGFDSESENRGGLPGSSSSGSGGVLADMGSENKDQGWFGNEGYRDLDQKQSGSLLNNQNQEEKRHNSNKFLTLPTVLTLGRVAAVPLLIGTFYVDSWWGTTATTSIFIAAAITDWLDGYIARRMRLGSAFGAFLDPVADKLMVAATLVLLCTKPFNIAMFGQVPWVLTVPAIAIIGREITMSAVREWAASQNTELLEAVAVNNLGKWKTAAQMIALTILLATRDSSLGGPGILVASGVVLLYISAGLAVWSLAVYMSKIWRVLLR
ncbi:hypothetical protein UlMin_025768 [Ulmus minor]